MVILREKLGLFIEEAENRAGRSDVLSKLTVESKVKIRCSQKR